MSNISIRGIDPANFSALKTMAAQEHSSVNALLLRLIDQGLGDKQVKPRQVKPTQGKPTQRRCDDLDALVGAWSATDAAEFAAATAAFEAVDPGLWK